MDDKRIDLKAALRELAAEESGKAGPHVGTKRLIAYRQGTLPADEREAVQEHLSLCPKCTGLLRELKDFESAVAEGDLGPEAPRQEAWESLARRLPPPPRPRRIPPLLYAVAAALLLAVLGLSFWATVTVQRSRQRLASVEQQLEERETALAETERQLEAAREQLRSRGQTVARVEELEARVTEMASALEELRRKLPEPGGERIATAAIELSAAPRFALRGQPSGSGFLQGKGAVNPVPLKEGRITLALNLAGPTVYNEYRFELVNSDGEVLWSGRRPGRSLLGDAGTSVTVNGVGPGTYRLRVEGLSAEKTELLGEYVLRVEGR